MEQQQARPPRLVLQMYARLAIFRDIGVKKVNLPALVAGKSLLDAGLPGAQRLHFRTSEHDSRLKAADNFVIMQGAAVLRHALLRRQALILLLPHGLFLFYLTRRDRA